MSHVPLLVIFAIIAVGAICQKRKILNAEQIEGFEIFMFKISMPSYLFTSILEHDLSALVNIPYIYSYLLAFVVISSLVVLAFYKYDKPSSVCLKVLACGNVNAGIYTLPVVTLLLGNPIAGVLVNLIQVIVIQTILITTLSILNHKEQSITSRLFKIFTTPIVVLPILALLINYFKFTMPPIVGAIFQGLGTGAPSIALFTFGLTIAEIKIGREHFDRNLSVIVVIKNIIHPLVAFGIGKYIFRLESYWLYSLLIAGSAPTAFIVYIIAKQFAVEQHLIKRAIAVSSIFSLCTLVGIAALLR